MDIPGLNKTVEKTQEKAKRAIPWLPSPMECPKCGKQTEASYAYDPAQAAFYAETNGKAPTWHCADCDTHYRRE